MKSKPSPPSLSPRRSVPMPTSDGGSGEYHLEAPDPLPTYANLFQLVPDGALGFCSFPTCSVCLATQLALLLTRSSDPKLPSCTASSRLHVQAPPLSMLILLFQLTRRNHWEKLNSGCLAVNGHPLQLERHFKNSRKGQRSYKEMGEKKNELVSQSVLLSPFSEHDKWKRKNLYGACLMLTARGDQPRAWDRPTGGLCCHGLSTVLAVLPTHCHTLLQNRSQECQDGNTLGQAQHHQSVGQAVCAVCTNHRKIKVTQMRTNKC